MDLNHKLVSTFNYTHQLTIGRTWERYNALSSKAEITTNDLAEIEKLRTFLLPYSTTPPAPELTPTLRNVNMAAGKGIVLNARKIAAAELSGAKALEIHRLSVALGKLISKRDDHLSPGELAQLEMLKARLLPFVGMEGYTASDADFQVAA